MLGRCVRREGRKAVIRCKGADIDDADASLAGSPPLELWRSGCLVLVKNVPEKFCADIPGSKEVDSNG